MVRTVQCDGYDVQLQCSPKRIVSTGAKVDAKSIAERPCFLCLNNLPAEQKGILYKEKFLFLCNPMPIFNHHCTVTFVEHQPQAIEPFFKDMLSLVHDLSPEFSLFYNGPRCGASAPDHMHFQASPKGKIPVEQMMLDPHRLNIHIKKENIDISSLKKTGRTALVLSGSDTGSIAVHFTALLSALKQMTGTDEEPLLNIIATYDAPVYRVILFLRTKHRPDLYFSEGENRRVVSPAAVDIGGLVVTPRESDFHALNGIEIDAIFREVSFTEEQFNELVHLL